MPRELRGDAVAERNARLPAQNRSSPVDRAAVPYRVARLRTTSLDSDAGSRELIDESDHLVERDFPAAGDVDVRTRLGVALCGGEVRAHDVVDVGEFADLRSVAVTQER